MKGNLSIRKLTLLLFCFVGAPSSIFVANDIQFAKATAELNEDDIKFIDDLIQAITDATNNIITFAKKFIDPQDKNSLNTYIKQLQQQVEFLRKITIELRAKKKTASHDIYRQAIKQTLDILANLNKNLIGPIYKCLVGKKTRAALSPSDRADLLAAALKISIDEFHANSSKELISQLNQLHSYLKELGLTPVAQTIEYVLELLVTADRNHKHSLTDAEKKTIKQAILLKIRLNE